MYQVDNYELQVTTSQSCNASYESRKKVGYYFKIRRSFATLSMEVRLGTSSFR